MSLWKVKLGRDIQEVTFSTVPVKNALQAIVRGQVEKECGGHYDFRGDKYPVSDGDFFWLAVILKSQDTSSRRV
jgi:hypothetical protein